MNCETVSTIIRDTADFNPYVKVNPKDTKYIKNTNTFRFPKMTSKGKKGGDPGHWSKCVGHYIKNYTK